MKKLTSLRSGVFAWNRRFPSWTRRMPLKRLRFSRLKCFDSDFSTPSSGSPMSREDQCGDQVSSWIVLGGKAGINGKFLDEDKSFNMLVSRVACIAKLQHKSIGYSGPLSRQLLCYRSLISEVRSALRNLIEVVLTGLLLSGDADRERTDWNDLSIR